MDTKKLLIGLGVVILLIAGFFLVFGGTEEDTEFDDTRANSYVNNEYDISFERPDGYDILEVEDSSADRYSIVLSRDEDSDIPEDGEGPPAITVDIFDNIDVGDVEIWLRANDISNYREDIALMETTVDGVRALSYEWDGLYRGRSVAFVHEDKVYLVSGTYLEASDPIFSDFEKVVNSIELR